MATVKKQRKQRGKLVLVSEETHKRLKVEAATRGLTSIGKLIEELLTASSK